MNADRRGGSSPHWSVDWRQFASIAVLLLAGAASARAEVVFQGVVAAGSVQRFALQDVDAGASRWCLPGDRFAGLTILRYDEAGERLVCVRPDGTTVELPLSVSHVRPLPLKAPAKQYAQVFLSDEVRERLRRRGETEADVYRRTLSALNSELGRPQAPEQRAQIQGLIDGFKAGLVKIYATEGKPLKYEDAPELKKEAVDRINQLQTMTLDEVNALIAKRKAEKAATQKQTP